MNKRIAIRTLNTTAWLGTWFCAGQTIGGAIRHQYVFAAVNLAITVTGLVFFRKKIMSDWKELWS